MKPKPSHPSIGQSRQPKPQLQFGQNFDNPVPIFPVLPEDHKDFDIEVELANMGFDLNNINMTPDQSVFEKPKNNRAKARPRYLPFGAKNEEKEENKNFEANIPSINTNPSSDTTSTYPETVYHPEYPYLPVIDPEIVRSLSKIPPPKSFHLNFESNFLNKASDLRENSELEPNQSETVRPIINLANFFKSTPWPNVEEADPGTFATLLPLINWIKDEPISLSKNYQTVEDINKGQGSETTSRPYQAQTEISFELPIENGPESRLFNKEEVSDTLIPTELPLLVPEFDVEKITDEQLLNVYQAKDLPTLILKPLEKLTRLYLNEAKRPDPIAASMVEVTSQSTIQR